MIEARQTGVRCVFPAGTGHRKGNAAEGPSAVPAARVPGPEEKIFWTVTQVESCHVRAYRFMLRHDNEYHDAIFIDWREDHEEIPFQRDRHRDRRRRVHCPDDRRGHPVCKRSAAGQHGLVAAAADHRHRPGAHHQGGLQRSVCRHSGRRAVYLRLCARRHAGYHRE